MNTVSIAAPKGYHWMQYEDGPALMVGEDTQHEDASEYLEFNVIGDDAQTEQDESIEKASNEYLRQALDLAKKQLPGWAWAVIHQTARGSAGGKARGAGLIKCDGLPQTKQAVDESLNKARVVFVVSEPNQLEKARDKLLVGADGVTFDSVYLKALGLVRADVSVCTVEDFLRAEITAPAVALGKLAKAALGDRVIASMPHPTAIRKLGDSGEVERKAKAIKKVLTIPAMSTNTTTKPTEPSGEFTVEITKASSDELRIVYGVVLDPYVEDAHGDIVPPKEVERTAHNWMAKSRIIGLQHSGMADAEPVESWLVPYPTDKDYQAAMRGEAHSATRSPFGTDVVHSGTWIIGTKLGPKEWQAVKDGELNAYSIGGFGKRNKVEQSALPAVNFIEGNLDG